MQIKLIELSSNASETEIEQVNRFLRSNKILSIDREFYTHMGEAKWTMLVVYQPKNDITINRDEKREKVDYKEILDEDAFEIYVQLKLIRKQLAEENALPLFAVFSNYELSQIAQLEEINEQTVCSISGIGRKRMEKYGYKMVQLYNEMRTANETSGVSEESDM